MCDNGSTSATACEQGLDSRNSQQKSVEAGVLTPKRRLRACGENLARLLISKSGFQWKYSLYLLLNSWVGLFPLSELIQSLINEIINVHARTSTSCGWSIPWIWLRRARSVTGVGGLWVSIGVWGEMKEIWVFVWYVIGDSSVDLVA